MIPINMPGGGGITAANYMAQIAPRDGTVIGIVSQGLAADQALGMSPQLKADLREFNWIANVVHSNQLLVVWHTSPTKTLEDAKKRETTIGTTGAGSASVQYPAFYNNVLGTKFKIVFGYPGGQDDRPRHGARRGRRPRHQSLFRLDGVEADLDSAEADHSARPGGRGEGAGAAGRAADPRTAGQAGGQAAPGVHGARRDRRAAARHHAGRSGRARGGAARGIRGDAEGPRIHRRRRARSSWTSSR